VRLRAVRGLFSRHSTDLAGLKRLWSNLTPAERDIPEVTETAAAAIAQAGDHEFAWKLIEQGLKHGLSHGLLQLFRELRAIPARERLLRAETWRERFGDDPALMLTLASLCVDESLWGKAEEFYLRACTGAQAAQAHYGLAKLYENTGKPAQAADAFRTAASIAINRASAPPSLTG
jgi:HemY protein